MSFQHFSTVFLSTAPGWWWEWWRWWWGWNASFIMPISPPPFFRFPAMFRLTGLGQRDCLWWCLGAEDCPLFFQSKQRFDSKTPPVRTAPECTSSEGPSSGGEEKSSTESRVPLNPLGSSKPSCHWRWCTSATAKKKINSRFYRYLLPSLVLPRNKWVFSTPPCAHWFPFPPRSVSRNGKFSSQLKRTAGGEATQAD